MQKDTFKGLRKNSRKDTQDTKLCYDFQRIICWQINLWSNKPTREGLTCSYPVDFHTRSKNNKLRSPQKIFAKHFSRKISADALNLNLNWKVIFILWTPTHIVLFEFWQVLKSFWLKAWKILRFFLTDNFDWNNLTKMSLNYKMCVALS